MMTMKRYAVDGRTKLAPDQVRAIFHDTRPQLTIAAEYGVKQSTVHKIKYARIRKSITRELFNAARKEPT